MHGEDINLHVLNMQAKEKTSLKDGIDRSNVKVSLAEYLGEVADSKI